MGHNASRVAFVAALAIFSSLQGQAQDRADRQSLDDPQSCSMILLGDLVEQNDNFVPNPKMLNQNSTQMWENVSRSFSRLDGVLPYIISPGNHDYGFKSSENTETHFPEYFPAGARSLSSPPNTGRAMRCSTGPANSSIQTGSRTTRLSL